MISVQAALDAVLATAAPLPATQCDLDAACGRVLARDLLARRTQPPADVSAMDGYAVRAADVAVAGARLTLVGEVAAGKPFDGAIGNGETVRIFTGGVLPQGADTVVIQELTTRSAASVIVEKATAKARNVRPAGLDFHVGAPLLCQGQRLSARDLALAAAMNHAQVPVHRAPRVAILATGDELIMPGAEPGPGQIVYSNGYALAALARAQGAQVVDLGIVADRLDATIAAIRAARAACADILVTTGGASVGDYDLVQQAFLAEKMALSFWKVALRPGRPLMHGRLGEMQVLGLPGNPVSSYVCALLFLVPLVRALCGRSDLVLPTEMAIADADLAANDERADYMRATLTLGEDAIPRAAPFAVQDSSMLAPLAKAGCLIVRAPHAPALAAGARCEVIRLDP